MHELSVAMSLLDEIGNVAEREHASGVSGVRLKIGRMSGISPEALKFAWELARADTVAANAELHIEDIDVTIFCPRCETERRPVSEIGMTCGVCGVVASRVVGGRELELVALELTT